VQVLRLLEVFDLEVVAALREAALQLGFVTAEGFDRVVDPAKMVQSYVAA
jgi:fumarate hydratase, class II